MFEKKWEFDDEVSNSFDDMLNRSIPQYNIMRETVSDIALQFLKEGDTIIDLGTSRGEAIAPLLSKIPSLNIFGIESSKPMLNIAQNRFCDFPNVKIMDHDLRKGLPQIPSVQVILSILTIQFIPIEYRQNIIQQIYDTLLPGGILIIVEKVLGSDSTLNSLMVNLYLESKRKNGYTEEQIIRKKASLEGVLVPMTSKWNEEMLKYAGFGWKIDCFWRWMNFSGWIAQKAQN